VSARAGSVRGVTVLAVSSGQFLLDLDGALVVAALARRLL
jgi:hypothetical protein